MGDRLVARYVQRGDAGGGADVARDQTVYGGRAVRHLDGIRARADGEDGLIRLTFQPVSPKDLGILPEKFTQGGTKPPDPQKYLKIYAVLPRTLS